MRDFFIYYSDVFKYETDVISVKEADVKKEDRGWAEDKERDHNHLCIEVSLALSSRVLYH